MAEIMTKNCSMLDEISNYNTEEVSKSVKLLKLVPLLHSTMIIDTKQDCTDSIAFSNDGSPRETEQVSKQNAIILRRRHWDVTECPQDLASEVEYSKNLVHRSYGERSDFNFPEISNDDLSADDVISEHILHNIPRMAANRSRLTPYVDESIKFEQTSDMDTDVPARRVTSKFNAGFMHSRYDSTSEWSGLAEKPSSDKTSGAWSNEFSVYGNSKKDCGIQIQEDTKVLLVNKHGIASKSSGGYTNGGGSSIHWSCSKSPVSSDMVHLNSVIGQRATRKLLLLRSLNSTGAPSIHMKSVKGKSKSSKEFARDFDSVHSKSSLIFAEIPNGKEMEDSAVRNSGMNLESSKCIDNEVCSAVKASLDSAYRATRDSGCSVYGKSSETDEPSDGNICLDIDLKKQGFEQYLLADSALLYGGGQCIDRGNSTIFCGIGAKYRKPRAYNKRLGSLWRYLEVERAEMNVLPFGMPNIGHTMIGHTTILIEDMNRGKSQRNKTNASRNI